MNNKLVLYCTKHEQAVLWEVCKQKTCNKSKCLFNRAAKRFGEELWSPKAVRFVTLEEIGKNLAELTKPRRFPVKSQVKDTPKRKFVILEESDAKPKAKVSPLSKPAPKTMSEMMKDMVKEAVMESR